MSKHRSQPQLSAEHRVQRHRQSNRPLRFLAGGALAALLMIASLLVANSPQAAAEPDPPPEHLAEVIAALETHIHLDAKGPVWEFTDDNRLSGTWLLDTPSCWGDAFLACPAVGVPPPSLGDQQFRSAIENDIAAARQSVDITTLLNCLGSCVDDCTVDPCDDFGGYPSGGFHQAIVDGLNRAASSGADGVQVRILGGQPIGALSRGQDRYLARLVDDLGSNVNRFDITVLQHNKSATSWNHAKIIAVDGKTAITGGQNLWTDAYQSEDPVADVSMRLEGPAARSAQKFVDELWADDACRPGFFASTITTSPFPCPTTHRFTASAPGNVPVLAVGSRGVGMEPEFGAGFNDRPFEETTCIGRLRMDQNMLRQNPELLALWALIESADHEIFISAQQLEDLSGCSMVDNELFRILAVKLNENKKVRIVVTAPNAARLGSGGSGAYTSTTDPWFPEIIDPLIEQLNALNGNNQTLTQQKICSNLQLGGLQHKAGANNWDNDQAIRNHAKVVSVDNEAFYIGSRNLYPAQLQEFGYIVEDSDSARAFNAEYADPLWENSKFSAVVNEEAGICYPFSSAIKNQLVHDGKFYHRQLRRGGYTRFERLGDKAKVISDTVPEGGEGTRFQAFNSFVRAEAGQPDGGRIMQQVARGNRFFARQRNSSGWTDFKQLDYNNEAVTVYKPLKDNGQGASIAGFNVYIDAEGLMTQELAINDRNSATHVYVRTRRGTGVKYGDWVETTTTTHAGLGNITSLNTYMDPKTGAVRQEVTRGASYQTREYVRQGNTMAWTAFTESEPFLERSELCQLIKADARTAAYEKARDENQSHEAALEIAEQAGRNTQCHTHELDARAGKPITAFNTRPLPGKVLDGE